MTNAGKWQTTWWPLGSRFGLRLPTRELPCCMLSLVVVVQSSSDGHPLFLPMAAQNKARSHSFDPWGRFRIPENGKPRVTHIETWL